MWALTRKTLSFGLRPMGQPIFSSEGFVGTCIYRSTKDSESQPFAGQDGLNRACCATETH